MRRMMGAIAATAVLLGTAAGVRAEDPAAYPSKPVTYVAPFAPGGATDMVARLLSEKLSQRTGQQFVVENKSGAGGLLGTRFVAEAAADGYTLAGASFNYMLYPTLFNDLTFDIYDDLTPVTQVVTYPSVLLVNPDLPVNTVADLVEYAKQNPGKVKFASSGLGTAAHLAGELLRKEAGIDIEHVPYRGGGPANADVVAGHVAMHFGPLGSAIEFIRGGRLKALAVGTAERAPALPDVPTMVESGYPDFVISEFQAVFVPAGTPPEIVDKLNREIVAILETPEVVEHFEGQGAHIAATSSAEFAEYLRTEGPRWNQIAKDAGIEPQ